jgi:5-methylcytosine-specific restriction enzyme subunit McrC
LILPETRALAAVELRDVEEGISLQALGLIGYLPLTPSITLNLRAKFPVGNLWEMLSLADETYERVLPVLRSYETANTAAPHHLLARGFGHYLANLLKTGISKEYHPDSHQGYFRPKLNFSETVARYLSRGDQVKVSSDTFSFSPRLRVNAVLKAACIDVLRTLPRDDKWSRERSLLLDALNALHRVTPARMAYGEQNLAKTLPSWSRDDYFGALNVYAVLLGYTGIGFLYEAQGSVLPSFLFKLDDIFERFARNSLRLSLRDAGISVADGNLPRNQGFLFHDSRRFPTKPDIIIRRNREGVPDAIAEVKYKSRIEEADRYQVISHVVAARAPVGIWISPALSNDEAGREYIGSISGGAKFYHYRIKIDGDLTAARADMARAISELLPSLG